MTSKSILTTLKGALGITEDVVGFDTELVSFANGAFLGFNQIGDGRPDGSPYILTDKGQLWSDYIADESIHGTLEVLLFLKVKAIFDPTASATVAKAFEAGIRELEFRLEVWGSENEVEV